MPSGTARPVARSHERRDDVLDALIALFFAEGFVRFSLEDLARRLACSKSTLYLVAASKEQIITAVVREIFRRSTERVEARLAQESDPVERIRVYLEAISAELSPADPTYFADLDAFGPAREVYRRNTAIAARRVQELVRDAGPVGIDPAFAGAAAGLVIEGIWRGEIEADTGLDDAAAFHALAQLVTAGVAGPPERNPR